MRIGRLLIASGVAWALGLGSPAVAANQEIELLHSVPSSVEVSSVVRNGSDRPEHLVDGNLATAWNSRTGKLAGSYIAFRVPAETLVTSIRMTVGFTHQDPRGDFFIMNHRITKVALYREDKLIGRFPLDPNQRLLQTIFVGQPGGSYRIEVEETLPGSKPHWREVCVTELEVWGTVPSTMTVSARVPTVTVTPSPSADAAAPDEEPGLVPGDLATHPTKALGPYPSLEAFCERWERAIAPIFAKSDMIYPPSRPFCSVSTKLSSSVTTEIGPAGALVEARLFDANEESHGVAGLALRKREGWHVLGLFATDDYDNPHCNGGTRWEITALRASPVAGGGARVTVRYRTIETTREFDENMRPRGERVKKSTSEVMCTVPAKGPPTCS